MDKETHELKYSIRAEKGGNKLYTLTVEFTKFPDRLRGVDRGTGDTNKKLQARSIYNMQINSGALIYLPGDAVKVLPEKVYQYDMTATEARDKGALINEAIKTWYNKNK